MQLQLVTFSLRYPYYIQLPYATLSQQRRNFGPQDPTIACVQITLLRGTSSLLILVGIVQYFLHLWYIYIVAVAVILFLAIAKVSLRMHRQFYNVRVIIIAALYFE